MKFISACVLLPGLLVLASGCQSHGPKAAPAATTAPAAAPLAPPPDLKRFGPPPPDYKADITEMLSRSYRLNNQDEYAFSEPRPGVVQDTQPGIAPEAGQDGLQNHYGWIVKVTATPRQKPPGYIGPRYFYFMFAEGHAGDVTDAFVRGYAAFVDATTGKRRSDSL